MTTEKKIEQYKQWLHDLVVEAKYLSVEHRCYRRAYEGLCEMFPEPVAVSIQDSMTDMLMEHANEVDEQMDREWKEKHGDQQDDTDKPWIETSKQYEPGYAQWLKEHPEEDDTDRLYPR